MSGGNAGARFLCVDAIPSQSSLYVPGPCAVDTDGNGWRISITEVRPLLVLDPEDRDEATRLCAAIPWLGEAAHLVDDMQAALRSLSRLTNPEADPYEGATQPSADRTAVVGTPDANRINHPRGLAEGG